MASTRLRSHCGGLAPHEAANQNAPRLVVFFAQFALARPTEPTSSSTLSSTPALAGAERITGARAEFAVSMTSPDETSDGEQATLPDTVPFWVSKSLEAMTPGEWESLCDGCGQCCLLKVEAEDTGKIYLTKVACHLLDVGSCQCSDYEIGMQACRIALCLLQTNCARSAGCPEPAPIEGWTKGVGLPGGTRSCPARPKRSIRPEFRCAAGLEARRGCRWTRSKNISLAK